MVVYLNVDFANAAACTLEVVSGSAKDIKVQNGAAVADPANNDIVVSGIAVLVYDGTQFILTNPATGD